MNKISNLMQPNMNYKKAFTLLEVLLAVAAVTILSGIVILAINPNKQLADARNAQRLIDVNTIMSAVYQYAFDHKGELPLTITTNPLPICRSGLSENCIDLSVLVLGQEYLTDIPVDPSNPLNSSSGYYIMRNLNNRVVVSAPHAEGTSISVTK